MQFKSALGNKYHLRVLVRSTIVHINKYNTVRFQTIAYKFWKREKRSTIRHFLFSVCLLSKRSWSSVLEHQFPIWRRYQNSNNKNNRCFIFIYIAIHSIEYRDRFIRPFRSMLNIDRHFFCAHIQAIRE